MVPTRMESADAISSHNFGAVLVTCRSPKFEAFVSGVAWCDSAI